MNSEHSSISNEGFSPPSSIASSPCSSPRISPDIYGDHLPSLQEDVLSLSAINARETLPPPATSLSISPNSAPRDLVNPVDSNPLYSTGELMTLQPVIVTDRASERRSDRFTNRLQTNRRPVNYAIMDVPLPAEEASSSSGGMSSRSRPFEPIRVPSRTAGGYPVGELERNEREPPSSSVSSGPTSSPGSTLASNSMLSLAATTSSSSTVKGILISVPTWFGMKRVYKVKPSDRPGSAQSPRPKATDVSSLPASPLTSSHDIDGDEGECPVCLEPLSSSFRLPGESLTLFPSAVMPFTRSAHSQNPSPPRSHGLLTFAFFILHF